MKGKAGKAARAEGQRLDPTVFVGREGASEATAAEAARQLETRRLIKVKIAPGAAEGGDRKAIAKELATKAGAELVEVRGFTALLASRKRFTKAAPKGPR